MYFTYEGHRIDSTQRLAESLSIMATACMTSSTYWRKATIAAAQGEKQISEKNAFGKAKKK